MENINLRQEAISDRNAFIERNLDEIKAIASTLTDDPEKIQDLTNEAVLLLLEYFANQYHHKPTALRKTFRNKIISALSDILDKDEQERINQTSLNPNMPAPEQNDPFDEVYLERRRQFVNQLLNQVVTNKKSNELIRRRYGCTQVASGNGHIVFDDKSHSVEEIHQWLKISKSGTHYALSRILIKLREEVELNKIRDYVDWDTPQIIYTNDCGIGDADINGQRVNVVDVNHPLSILGLGNSHYFYANQVKIFKEFKKFIASEGIERFEEMVPVDFKPSIDSYFIRLSDFEKAAKKFKKLNKKI